VGWAGLVTLTSLLAAWTAITFLLQENLKLAIIFSVVAFLLDTLDGFLARKLGTASIFGRYFDSMVDAINYSLLAALVTEQVLLPGSLGYAIGFLILAAGILRLVLFSIEGFDEEAQKLYYIGIVTPHLTLATALIYFATELTNIPEWLIAITLGALALLQLSTIRTLKTGVLIFWIPTSIAIAVGAVVWL
jgi:CDP-diacylglycerol--serine O-phosphatidyltransferase